MNRANYQRIVIDRAVQTIVQGKKRVLLSMSTATLTTEEQQDVPGIQEAPASYGQRPADTELQPPKNTILLAEQLHNAGN
jgi:hypothetical protein